MLSEINRNNVNELRAYLDSRSQEIENDILTRANTIIRDVRMHKDEALRNYTRLFDDVDLDVIRADSQEIEEACQKCDPFFMESMERAKENITYFHKAQINQSYILQKEKGIYLGERVLPLQSVGIYVPGGRAQYPSSVLMNAIPAKAAGVKRIVMVTPPNKDGKLNPNIAFSAKLAGVDEIYKVAQEKLAEFSKGGDADGTDDESDDEDAD